MKNAELLIQLSLYVTIIIAVLAAGATIVGSIVFWRTQQGAADAFSLLLRRANALQMLTVILIILAAFALRILDLIGPEAVVTLFSGIAGYVLGGTGRAKQGQKAEQ
jgi:hypothetical protein